ncbi:MAG: alpha/beta hydrolase [Gammaproteobacteria bacterium]|nr:alpha/beta hydrolase [Gammaproteobacteria bacterium]
MPVSGASLAYVEQGTGTPVVLVHGAPSDHRMWLRHCEWLAAHGFRAIAFTQRYFGTDPWNPDWPPFGTRLHANDLGDLLAALEEPPHVIAWSYGAHVALAAAVERPRLMRSLFVYEPGFPTWVSDPEQLREFSEDAERMFGPAAAAVQRSDNEAAARALIDASGGSDGYFDSQPEDRRRIQLDNARVMPKLFSQSSPVEITCEQLRALEVPTAITWGARTRALFRVVSAAAAACVRGQHASEVANATHMWPEEDPEGFCRLAVRFSRVRNSSGPPAGNGSKRGA